MVLRPDEEAAEEYIDRDRRFRGKVGGGLKTAATLAAGAAGGIGGKLMPFLNQYIPSDLAVKGISKISPQIGAFLKKGQSMGLDIEDGLNFVKEKFMEKESADTGALHGEDEDIIMKFSPKLSKLVKKLVEAGHPIEEVEQIARSPGQRSAKDVEHMEKSLGMTFYDILRSVFGGGKRTPPQGQSQQQPQQQTPPQQQMQQGQPQSQGQGQGQAALMAILQKLQQSRGQPQ